MVRQSSPDADITLTSSRIMTAPPESADRFASDLTAFAIQTQFR